MALSFNPSKKLADPYLIPNLVRSIWKVVVAVSSETVKSKVIKKNSGI